MKPVSAWNIPPYTPSMHTSRKDRPYVCRILPYATTLDFDFIDECAPKRASHTLYYRILGGTYTAVFMEDSFRGQICNLRPRTEYEFYVERDCDGVCSEVRRIRTGVYPGRAVHYLHPKDPFYAFSGNALSSPCLCRLPSGKLLASMDVTAKGASQCLTLLFYSEDNGTGWHYLTELYPCCHGQLFYQNGRLYVLALSAPEGDILIGASDNEGIDWTMPTVLFRGSYNPNVDTWYRSPTSLTQANGRLYASLSFGHEGSGMDAHVLSAPDDAVDYTDPAVWTLSDGAPTTDSEQNRCALDGSMILLPDGTLYQMMHYGIGQCLLFSIAADDPSAAPIPQGTVVTETAPSKFDVRYDPVSASYYALCNRTSVDDSAVYTVLSLFVSKDALHWSVAADVLNAGALPASDVGFRSVSFVINDNDILFLSCTAYGNAISCKDANYITFHKIENFREIGNAP